MADENIAQSKRQDGPVNSPYTKALLRFFSVESDIHMAANINNQPPEFNNNHFYSKEFILKLAQLSIGIICAGLYSEGVKIMTKSITSLSFPNVVFTSFIIITAVIIMSYILGRVMPDILIRVFNAIATVLYFTSATVSIVTWCNEITTKELETPAKFLLIQAILSYINSALYGLDMFFSIKSAIVFTI